jgi:hypothetical protein
MAGPLEGLTDEQILRMVNTDLMGAIRTTGVPEGHGAAILRSGNAGESMTIALSGPVSAFFEAERTRDLEALGRCFSDRAIVRDEGRTVEGPDAIKRWMKEAKAKYNHTVEPLGVTHRDGLTVVTARVAGTFPNSPLDLQHLFAVAGGKIVSLEIR